MGRTLTRKDTIKFEKAAKKQLKQVTASKESALKYLVKLGTHTPKGRLTKNYK